MNQVACVEKLVFQPVKRLSVAEAGIAWFAPDVTGGGVPGEVARIEGIVYDTPAQRRHERVVPRHRELRAPVLPHGSGPVAIQTVDRKLNCTGVIAERRSIAGDFLRERGVGQ